MTFRIPDDVLCQIYGIKDKSVPVYFDAKDLTEIAKLSAERDSILEKLKTLNERYSKTSRLKIYFYDTQSINCHYEEVSGAGTAGIEIHSVLQDNYKEQLKVVDEQLEAYGVKVKT